MRRLSDEDNTESRRDGDDHNSPVISIRLPEGMLEEIGEFAEMERYSRSAAIRTLIRRGLGSIEG
jgi:metal-responsive CopG/Arc/MetJ family transcriptional regulator